MEAGLQIVDREFNICTRCERAYRLLQRNFSAVWGAPSLAPEVSYEVVAADDGWQIISQERTTTADPADLIYMVERRLVLDLQASRPDLLFVHAAVLGDSRGAVMLVAPSGTGKSTTALALIERGLRYLSDELAPVDVGTGMVHPYPHALCLKSALPAAYVDSGFHTGVTGHIPAEPLNFFNAPLPLRALVLLEREQSNAASLEQLSQAQAVTYLFPQILNGLAHPAFGIDAAICLTTSCAAFLLRLGAVDESADLLMAELVSTVEGAAA